MGSPAQRRWAPPPAETDTHAPRAKRASQLRHLDHRFLLFPSCRTICCCPWLRSHRSLYPSASLHGRCSPVVPLDPPSPLSTPQNVDQEGSGVRRRCQRCDSYHLLHLLLHRCMAGRSPGTRSQLPMDMHHHFVSVSPYPGISMMARP